MKPLLSLFIVMAAVVIFYIGIINFASYHIYGGYISKKTEEKYLRHINQYERLGNLLFLNGPRGDSLTSASIVYAHEINLFTKYYILHDVGCVRPGSLLEKKFDSIWNNNKLK